MRWLVCGGGNLKFVLEVGMLEALVECDPDWTPDALVGTSAGALVVGLIADRLAAGKTFAQAVAELGAIVDTLDRPAQLVKERRLGRLLWPIQALTTWRGVVGMEPLRALIAEHAPNAAAHPNAWVCVFDTATRLNVYRAPTVDMILASASVPIAAPPVKGFADGGVRDVVPLKFAIQGGATDVVVCRTQVAERPRLGPAPTSLLGQAKAAVGGLEREVLATDLDVKLCRATNALVLGGLAPDKTLVRLRDAQATQRFDADIRRFTKADVAAMRRHGRLVGRAVFSSEVADAA